MARGIRVERFRHVESLLPIIELLEQSTNLGAREEALRILAHICSDEDCRTAIRQAGGVRGLVEVLESPNENKTLLENGAKVVRNLANDSPATRKALRQSGAIEPLVRLMSLGEDSPITVDAIAAIGYLSHRDPLTKAAVRRMGGIPLLVRMLHADVSKTVTCYAAAALHNLVEGSTRNKLALRAAGAIPRLVQLLEVDLSNPVVEVAVRTLQKLAEKCEDNQSDIRRARGIAKLVELQSKGASKSLSQWVEKTLQTLKLTEREMDDTKVLMFLGKSFQKEFDKVRNSSDQVLSEIASLKESVNTLNQQLLQQISQHQDENGQLRAIIDQKSAENLRAQGVLNERVREVEDMEVVLDDKDKEIQEMQDAIEEKEEEVREFQGLLDDKEQHIAQLEALVEEKDRHIEHAQVGIVEKARQIEQAEGLVMEKDRMILEAQARGRDEWRQYQSERDSTILQMVQTLRDLIIPATTETHSKQSMLDISESIKSLLQSTSRPTEANPHLIPQPFVRNPNTVAGIGGSTVPRSTALGRTSSRQFPKASADSGVSHRPSHVHSPTPLHPDPNDPDPNEVGYENEEIDAYWRSEDDAADILGNQDQEPSSAAMEFRRPSAKESRVPRSSVSIHEKSTRKMNTGASGRVATHSRRGTGNGSLTAKLGRSGIGTAQRRSPPSRTASMPLRRASSAIPRKSSLKRTVTAG